MKHSCTTSQIPFAGSDAKSVKLYDIKEVQEKISAESKSFAPDLDLVIAQTRITRRSTRIMVIGKSSTPAEL